VRVNGVPVIGPQDYCPAVTAPPVPRSARTERAYAADVSDFATWCNAHGHRALPASATVIAAYVDALITERRVSTVQRRVAAIRAAHVDRGLRSPTDRPEVTAAIARAHWRRRDDVTHTDPIGVAELRAMTAAAPASPTGARDRALLLVGYGAGLRPGELTALAIDDVRLVPSGMTVRAARGRVVVPFGSDRDLCAVRAWKAWRRIAVANAGGGGSGPAFRAIDRHGRVGADELGEKAVTRIVRRAAARAGLDATRWSGGSLRRGMVLAATERGVTDRAIMSQTGHRNRRLVRRYMREG
jgi:site-specific recombinase XerD